MIRRRFIQRIAGATAGMGLTGAAGAADKEPAGKSVQASLQVKGFTCITCAIGLEVLLREQDGIVRVKASYPERKVAVTFDPSVTTIDAIKTFINRTTGFTVVEQS